MTSLVSPAVCESAKMITESEKKIEEFEMRDTDFLNISGKWNKFDVKFLEVVIEFLHYGDSEMIEVASQILIKLKEDPNILTVTSTVINYSKSKLTQYFILEILEDAISKGQWDLFSERYRSDLKKYIMCQIMKLSGIKYPSEEEEAILDLLNQFLVQILKYEWPQKWPTFIKDLISASESNYNRCINSLHIFRLISSQLLGISGKPVSQEKKDSVIKHMSKEFICIFRLCKNLIVFVNHPELLRVALETILLFIEYIPSAYIYEQEFIRTILNRFFSDPVFRNYAMLLLFIIILAAEERHYELVFVIAEHVERNLGDALPSSWLKYIYEKGLKEEKRFVFISSKFILCLLQEYWKELYMSYRWTFNYFLNYLLSLSEIDDIEISRACFDLWNEMLCLNMGQPSEILEDCETKSLTLKTYISSSSDTDYIKYYRCLSNSVLSELRGIAILKISKTKEISKDDTVALQKYKDSRELYYYTCGVLLQLTYLNNADTIKIITEKLQAMLKDPELPQEKLEHLICAATLLNKSNVLHSEYKEKKLKNIFYILSVVLISKIESDLEEEEKTVPIFNLMNLIEGFLQFLKGDWVLLKCVVTKLFEFMKAEDIYVQNMAFKTFIVVSKNCREEFIKIQNGETMPYRDEILKNSSIITYCLSPELVSHFYEAVGYMILSSDDVNIQEEEIERFFSLPEHEIDSLFQKMFGDPEMFYHDSEFIKRFLYVLNMNVGICRALGYLYYYQLDCIYMNLLTVGKIVNPIIHRTGKNTANDTEIKNLRALKNEILKLFSTWIESLKNHEPLDLFWEEFYHNLKRHILNDFYYECTDDDCKPGVISLLTSIISTLKTAVFSEIPSLVDCICIPITPIIRLDYQNLQELRTVFSLFIETVATHCLPVLKSYPDLLNTVLNSALHAASHYTMENVALMGLKTLVLILRSRDQTIYKNHYISILAGMLTILRANTALHAKATVLASMLKLVKHDNIKEPLAPVNEQGTLSNFKYIQHYMVQFIEWKFEIEWYLARNIVKNMFYYCEDFLEFTRFVEELPLLIKEYSEERIWQNYPKTSG